MFVCVFTYVGVWEVGKLCLLEPSLDCLSGEQGKEGGEGVVVVVVVAVVFFGFLLGLVLIVCVFVWGRGVVLKLT